ncbi:MAG: LppX_LprAFG lipoprotein [Aggregatilineales bacterium]
MRSLRTALVLMCFTLAACGTPTASPTPPPDPRTLLSAAAADIQAVSALRFKLQLTGAPAFIDDDGIISFSSADGVYVAPDKVSAKVSAAVAGVAGQIDIVTVGDEQYMKHILLTANRWLNMQFSPGFNAERLIRGDLGIKYALNALTDLTYHGVVDLFGTPVHHISGRASVADISAVTVNLIRGTGSADADIYINTVSGRVERIVLVQPETVSDQHPEPTTWIMELFDYDDRSISVEVPRVEALPTATPSVLGAPALPTLPSRATPEVTQAP